MIKENLDYIGKQLFVIVIILLLAVIVFGLGLMVGYGVVGDGSNVWSILSLDKWQELLAKFTGK